MNRLLFRTALAWLAFGAMAQAPAATFRVDSVTWTTEGLEVAWTDDGPPARYVVQARDRLAGGLWLAAPLTTQPWPLAGWSFVDPDTAGASSRWYRVVAVAPAERGRVLEVSLLQRLSPLQISFYLSIQKIPVTPEYTVDVYRVVYETLDAGAGRTEASGVLAVPRAVGRPLPLLSYQHGTLAKTTEAPSVSLVERLPGVIFASVGYAAVVPDFLGLGGSPGLHPYHHARSEATAGVDLLRAARTWCATNGVALNDQLFLAGYSQGGHVTLALQRELETFHAAEFTVTASAPMAGAYDLSGVTADDALSGRPLPNPYYFGLLLAAYQEVYHLTNTLAELLAPPYDTTLPPLLKGTNLGTQINAAMPAQASLVLRPEVLAAFETDPSHPLRLALRDNDLYHWTPRAPTRLYHCRGDQDVPFANSEVALSSFHDRGATQVTLTDPQPDADHSGCVLPSFLDARAWFDSLRQ